MKILGRESRLSTLLDQTCRAVSALDPNAEGAVMLEQILRARPELEQKIYAPMPEQAAKARDVVMRAVGVGAVTQVKNLPAQVNALVDRINNRSTEPALRCALVTVLAYVCQTRDLVPDDAPGGYGFVDDYAMVTATMLQLLEPTPTNAQRIEEAQRTLASLQSLLPDSASSAIQLAIQGIVLLFQSARLLPAQVADAMTQQILDSPEGVTAPQAPMGFKMPNMSPPGAGHWSGGAYFQGGNVVMPGGPSLIDGQLYIPD